MYIVLFTKCRVGPLYFDYCYMYNVRCLLLFMECRVGTVMIFPDMSIVILLLFSVQCDFNPPYFKPILFLTHAFYENTLYILKNHI